MAAIGRFCSAESSVLACALVAVAFRGSEKSCCNNSIVEKNKKVGNVHALTEWLREGGAREKKAVVIG